MSKKKRLYKIFKGEGGKYGVCGIKGGILYDAEDTKEVAQIICDICNEHPDWEWERQVWPELAKRLGYNPWHPQGAHLDGPVEMNRGQK